MSDANKKATKPGKQTIPEKVAKQENPGAISSARDMVSQLQEQAKNGQIDGNILDQLEAILNVAVDQADDVQPEMKDEAEAAAEVETAPELESAPTSTAPNDVVTSEETDVAKSLGKAEDGEAEEPANESEESETDDEPELEKELDKMDDNEIQKSEPASARPPRPNLIFDGVEDLNSKLPSFIKAMESGSMKTAQKIAGETSTGFDTLFNMAQHAILNEGGFKVGNLGKLNSPENIMGDFQDAKVKKSITASTVPGIYLIRLAKLMLPVYAGLTSRIPTDSPKTGSDQATWKAQLGFGSLSEKDFFRVAEASIGVNPPTNFLTFEAPYNDLSSNDSVTLKALRASAGYSDPLQIAVIKAMSALIRGQERVLLGGTRAAIAAVTSAVTITQGGPAQTVIAAGSYVVGVTALTYEGWLAQSKGGSAAIGETTGKVCTQFVLGSGSSMTVTWDAVPGAVAYNLYLSGSSGDVSGSTATYHSTVKFNKAVISTMPSGSAGLTMPSGDTTVNATYGMEGLISWCERSTILSNAIPDKQTIYDNAGAGLTAGNGGITQFDSILADLWTNWHTAPSLMVMSPNMNSTLVGKLQSLGSGGFYRIEVGNERNTVNGGMMVTGYVNKFAPFADGTPRMIDVIPHPYMPDGKVLFMSETIPYPMGNETRGFVRDVLVPYTYFPLPSQASGVNQITYNFALYTSMVLECFNPGPQASLVGVDYES